MREIKFRAWDNVAREMLVVKQLEFGRNQSDAIWAHLSDGIILHQQHLEIMQYTGLKDKNGKEIYEGDILIFRETGFPDITVSVEWANGGFVYKWESGSTSPIVSYPSELNFEVIGNIYENPE